jgi:uncharacterized membrane protein
MAFGEILTGWLWHPPGSSSVPAALTVVTYGSESMIIKYPVFPWLAIMALGWVFGRRIVQFAAGRRGVSPTTVMAIAGGASLFIFVIIRGAGGYGDMFLHRADNSWQQWLHVSKYPPSLTFYGLELGLLFLCLAALMAIEPLIGVRPNGPFMVFGQTSMFFYLVHRLAFEIPATYFGLRGAGTIVTTYVVAALMLVLLYPACRWYRTLKRAHPQSLLKYF